MRDWTLWLIAAVLLAVAEVLSLDLVLIMLAGAALVTAGAAVVTDSLVIQGLVFAVTAVLGLLVARPVATRHFKGGPEIRTGVAALEGASAQVLRRVGEHEGLVRINGEDWTARVYDSTQVLEPGDRARVMEIKGATAMVWKEQ